jgi:hypothetical protein
MRYYAVLKEDSICSEIRGVHEEIELHNYISLDKEDISVLGKRYNNGEWEEVELQDSIPKSTEDEILQAEMLLNQQLILSKQTEIDMTLAELLLNQQGVSR